MRTVPVLPKKIETIEAGSYFQVPYLSRDRALALEALTTLRYRIDNLSDGEVVTDWTNVSSPGSSGTITIPGSTNVISRSWRNRQINQVTLEKTTATGVIQETVVYEIAAVTQGAA